jgi:hypothetical protein
MTDKLLEAPLGVFGLTNTGAAEQKVLACFNNSGAVLQHGDVVIIDNSAGQMPAVVAGAQNSITGAVTTTAGAKSPLVAGAVSATSDASTSSQLFAAGATVPVCFAGCARVNVGAGVAAANSFLQTAAVLKQAVGNAAPAAGDIGTIFGVALEAAAAKDANSTIRAFLRPA